MPKAKLSFNYVNMKQQQKILLTYMELVIKIDINVLDFRLTRQRSIGFIDFYSSGFLKLF